MYDNLIVMHFGQGHIQYRESRKCSLAFFALDIHADCFLSFSGPSYSILWNKNTIQSNADHSRMCLFTYSHMTLT